MVAAASKMHTTLVKRRWRAQLNTPLGTTETFHPFRFFVIEEERCLLPRAHLLSCRGRGRVDHPSPEAFRQQVPGPGTVRLLLSPRCLPQRLWNAYALEPQIALSETSPFSLDGCGAQEVIETPIPRFPGPEQRRLRFFFAPRRPPGSHENGQTTGASL